MGSRNLPVEFNNFAKNKRQLRKIFSNTRNNLQEIVKSDYFDRDQLKDVQLHDEVNHRLEDITENPIGIIILGSKSWAKAAILNELLGYALLPVSPPHPEDSYSANNWRTVRFMYGPQTQVSLAVANCYELVEHLAVYDRVWHQIPRSDLELRDSRESDGYYSATLEIKLPHALLQDDVQIIVAPSPASHYSFESIYHSCFEGVSPIIIYALSDSCSLSSREVDDLMELRRLQPKTPVYFIRAQRQTGFSMSNGASEVLSSASELTESQQHLLFKSSTPSPPSSSPPFGSPYSAANHQRHNQNGYFQKYLQLHSHRSPYNRESNHNGNLSPHHYHQKHRLSPDSTADPKNQHSDLLPHHSLSPCKLCSNKTEIDAEHENSCYDGEGLFNPEIKRGWFKDVDVPSSNYELQQMPSFLHPLSNHNGHETITVGSRNVVTTNLNGSNTPNNLSATLTNTNNYEQMSKNSAVNSVSSSIKPSPKHTKITSHVLPPSDNLNCSSKIFTQDAPQFFSPMKSSQSSSPSLYQQLCSLGFTFNRASSHHHHHHHLQHPPGSNELSKACTPTSINAGNIGGRFPYSLISSSRKSRNGKVAHTIEVYSELVEDFDNFKSIVPFARQVLNSYIVEAANMLYDSHSKCLRMFIMTAFDMTRDMMITPKRIEYAKQNEQHLFNSLMAIANKKQEEIKNIISDTIASMKEELIKESIHYKFKFNARLNREGHELTSMTKHQHSIQQHPVATTQHALNSSGEDVDKYSSPEPGSCDPALSMHPLHSSLSSGPGSGSEHLSCLPSRRESDYSSSSTSSMEFRRLSAREIQIAMSEIQDMVLSKLNVAIAGKLIGSVDWLRSSYIGTLERCLENLENLPHSNAGLPGLLTNSNSSSKISENIAASNALKQILNAAYQVEINMRTTSSLIRAFWEKMKQLVATSFSWRHHPIIDDEWKKKVAADVFDSLSESRLAKSICSQFKERLRLSHEQFAAAMKHLEAVHSGRLEKTEEQRVRVRKYYAPRIARNALEATSLRDVVLYGMPELGREIGRGQYGVVFACDQWAGCSPVALKSVVPPDEKHWNDLAMEFYYTRSIPEHERVVQIRGSVIDHSYGGGSTSAVLLIMDRLSRDLYSAIKNGLDWLSRLQVAIDVIQGIRFLHSQGLVHRDIKLKNVLLDKRNRAKITDLGFCKPGAMMSGSIVGTPIHMAPELFTGKYDSSVDVYAFGILFWYICAGHVHLPYIFEQCQNKDQLWSCVRKGVRPERLPQFDDDCWAIMEACWAKEPSQRPLLGDIEPKLVSILENYKTRKQSSGYKHRCLFHV